MDAKEFPLDLAATVGRRYGRKACLRAFGKCPANYSQMSTFMESIHSLIEIVKPQSEIEIKALSNLVMMTAVSNP